MITAGVPSSPLLGESTMRRGGGRDDDPGRSMDDRGTPGKGEKLPGARPWGRPVFDGVGCILAVVWRARYILAVAENMRQGDSGVVVRADGPRHDVATRASGSIVSDSYKIRGARSQMRREGSSRRGRRPRLVVAGRMLSCWSW